MSHLRKNNTSYFKHLVRTWRWSLILIIHGLFPQVWQTKVSDEICGTKRPKKRVNQKWTQQQVRSIKKRKSSLQEIEENFELGGSE